MHVKEQRHTLHPIWRVTIVFVAAIVLWLLVQNTVSALFGSEYSRTTHAIRAVLIFSFAVPMVVAARRLLDHKTSFSGLGRFKDAWRPFVVGVAAWLIPASLMLVTAVTAGWTDIVVNASAVAVLGNLVSLIALVFIFEAFPEELIFRGYIFRNLAAVKPLWFAVIGQAVLFMTWGALNGGEVTASNVLLFLVFGLVVGAMRVITGSVWAGIGYHVAFQTIAQLFGSVGGGDIAFSSEGVSMLVIGAAPIAFAIPVLGWFYKKRPDWRARISE
jgi:membrane protease YdiL (CAAX protease family)